MPQVDDERWVRLYRPGPLRVLAGGSAALGCVVLVSAGSVVIGATRHLGERLVLSAIVLGIVGPALWWTGRVVSAGVWVRRSGIRFVTPLRTRTYTWADAGLRRHHDPFDALWCEALEPAWRTPVSTRALDFRWRPEAYEIAVTAALDWSAPLG